ncbi:MAG: tRNA lysidine(34) synthetase TilS [Gammaproteobacteria bacterium]|nr:tRNA lysidine(34) synthetase TilS [Gammaproteobacteria bacterium]
MLHSLKMFFQTKGTSCTYLIAYSGGLDSHVLLHLCATIRNEIPLKLLAVYINHGLSPHAQTWSEHCAKICAQYHIPFTEEKIQMHETAGESIEERARQLRYAVFSQCIGKEDVLLTAHHQDDQAETVLLQLLRGAGTKGLAAMPPVKPFAEGLHARPLLLFSRATLQQYAENHQLQWIEDESNQNTRFARNFIRHDVFSLLKTRWPTIAATLARTASHCAEAQSLLEEFTLTICENVKGTQENTLSVSKLLALSSARQRLVLRSWVHSLGFSVPDTRKIHAILQNVLKAKWDSMPCVRWQTVELRRYRDDIFLMPALAIPDPKLSMEWDSRHPLPIANLGLLRTRAVLVGGLRAGLNPLWVRFRQGGEIVHLAKRGKHTLKNLFQEWSVPPWQRSRLPLIFVDETLVAVPGYFIHPDYVAHEAGHEIVWEWN